MSSISNIHSYVEIPRTISLGSRSSRMPIQSEFFQRVFEMSVIAPTQNRGKIADEEIYVALKRSPATLNKDGVNALNSCGFRCSDEGSLLLSPDRVSSGKCFGGTVSFLANYHKTGDVHKIAETFKDGIPIEGVLTQEVYKTLNCIFETDPLEEELVEVLFSRSVMSKEGDAGYPVEVHHDPECSTILKIAREFRIRGLDVREDDFVSYVTERYKKKHGEYPSLRHYVILQNMMIADRIDPNSYQTNSARISLARRIFALRLNDLEIERTLVFHSSADEVIQAMSALEPGTYELTFPAYSCFGSLKGLHATALIVESDATYFYDPNFIIGKTENPDNMIKHIFKIYNGYGNNAFDVFSRIKNIFKKNASPPLFGKDKSFCLYKIIPIRRTKD